MLKEMLISQDYSGAHDKDTYNLPKIGYIAFYNKIPVAAGFLRRVEGDVIAQIDGLTSNPFFGSIIRHNALSQVLDRLILDAEELELKGLMAFCLDPSSVKRAESIGFEVIKHTILTKLL